MNKSHSKRSSSRHTWQSIACSLCVAVMCLPGCKLAESIIYTPGHLEAKNQAQEELRSAGELDSHAAALQKIPGATALADENQPENSSATNHSDASAIALANYEQGSGSRASSPSRTAPQGSRSNRHSSSHSAGSQSRPRHGDAATLHQPALSENYSNDRFDQSIGNNQARIVHDAQDDYLDVPIYEASELTRPQRKPLVQIALELQSRNQRLYDKNMALLKQQEENELRIENYDAQVSDQANRIASLERQLADSHARQEKSNEQIEQLTQQLVQTNAQHKRDVEELSQAISAFEKLLEPELNIEVQKNEPPPEQKTPGTSASAVPSSGTDNPIDATTSQTTAVPSIGQLTQTATNKPSSWVQNTAAEQLLDTANLAPPQTSQTEPANPAEKQAKQ